MFLYALITKAALLVAMTLSLAACSKQNEQPNASTQAAASAPMFPTTNSDKARALADCDKLPDPERKDDSAAGRATAVSLGIAARDACKREITAQLDKPNADLARIREIKEKEEAKKVSRDESDAAWKQQVMEGAKAPLKEYKH